MDQQHIGDRIDRIEKLRRCEGKEEREEEGLEDFSTATKGSEEDDEYDWGHLVGDMKWLQWSKVQESHQGWECRGYQGPGGTEAMCVDEKVSYEKRNEKDRTLGITHI